MEMFVIEGGHLLSGRTSVAGSKNASLPILSAALACAGESRLLGVPELVDVRTLSQLLVSLGCEVERQADGSLTVLPVDDRPYVADYELVRRMRASVCVLGPLLARRRRACVSLPGGCNIGHRPIDLHLKGLAALGANIRIERGYVIAEADRLQGTRISLASPWGSTVTGTCNVLAAAALARGTTVIEAAACEPEVVDLGRFLIAAGACIEGLGTPVITIDGVDELQGAEHAVIPDRIEAATLILAAAITRGRIQLANVPLDQMTSVLELLQAVGVQVRELPGSLRTPAPGDNSSTALATLVEIDGTRACRPAEFTATPYPGVPTDIQAQFTSLLTLADGISVVTDAVFPERFMHVSELLRMGARLKRMQNSVVISGVPRLHAASVMASDLRASAALVLAALASQGESVIRRIYHLDRGYAALEQKLSALGAVVRRVKDLPENVPAGLRFLDAA